MKKIKKPGTILMLFGAAMVAAALLLILWNIKEQFRAEADTQAIIRKIEPVITRNLEANAKSGSDEIPDVLKEFPVFEIDGVKYMAVLVIPSLELELAVRDEWSYDSLQISPCRYFGSVSGKNLVICAHNYNAHFGQLGRLVPGDAIHLADINGDIRNYKVALVETLNPSDISMMIESEYPLTLFTCTLGGATRVTVRCQLAD